MIERFSSLKRWSNLKYKSFLKVADNFDWIKSVVNPGFLLCCQAAGGKLKFTSSHHLLPHFRRPPPPLQGPGGPPPPPPPPQPCVWIGGRGLFFGGGASYHNLWSFRLFLPISATEEEECWMPRRRSGGGEREDPRLWEPPRVCSSSGKEERFQRVVAGNKIELKISCEKLQNCTLPVPSHYNDFPYVERTHLFSYSLSLSRNLGLFLLLF